MAPSALAGIFGAWEQSVGTYDLDTNKTACIAKTVGVKKNSELMLIFPKDKTSLPLIRMNNLNRWKQYIGASYGQGSNKLKGFIVKRGRQQSYYLMAPNAAAFESFITTVRAKSSMQALKLFDDRGVLKANPADFSLSGSTNATNAIKTCLGSSSFLSATQKSLFSALQRFNNTRPLSISRDISGLESRGMRIFSALRNIISRGGEMQRLGEDLRRRESNTRYKEIKPIYVKNSDIKSTQTQIIGTLNSNQDFYDQAGELISKVEASISQTQERIELLTTQRTALEVSISEANQTLSTLQVDVDSANRNLSQNRSDLSIAQKRLNDLNAQSSNLSNEMKALERSLAEMNGQRRLLNQAIFEAENRYNNRNNIARQIENDIYARFGGTPRQLRESLDLANADLRREKALKDKSVELSDIIDETLTHLVQIPAINRRLKSINDDLACYQSNNANERASCVQKAVNAAKKERNDLIKERDIVASDKCKRLFNIGESKCKRRRNTSVANFNKQIEEVQSNINALNARIKVIAETGQDPQKNATVRRLREQKNQLVAKRKVLLANASNKIQSMRIPSDRSDRGQRGTPVFTKAIELKSCAPRANRTCLNVAKAASESMNKLSAQSSSNEERSRNKINKINTSIANMEKALRREVDGLAEKLRKELDNAKTRYQNNETSIVNADTRVQRIITRRESLRAPISNARSQVVSKEGLVTAASARLRVENKKVQDFKDQVGYNNMISASSSLMSQITTNSSTLNLSKAELKRLTDKQSKIAAEVHTYPERLNTANVLNDEATRILEEIGSEYEGLERGIRNVRSQFDRLFTALKPSLQTFQEQIRTVFSKF